MNTSSLKSFAPAVRKQLMEAVTRKLDFALAAQTSDYRTTFAPQVAALRKLERADRTGLVERVAYTWFNRFAALRFMDARGWHPFRARVLTPASATETQPELLKLTRTGALPEELRIHTNAARLNDLLDGRIPSPDAQGEVYRHLVLAACRFYNALLPDLFERLDDETELLLPDDLLTEQSVVHGFRTEIGDGDCGEVEILGWLYQFYISDKKDAVMARKSAVPTEDIPAVTQLFTPHWIVRYLVENSLGRLWLLNRPQSRLRAQMPYYIEGEAETGFLKIGKPEEIKLLDPASGSGHMLTYAFDLLFAIYEEEGYAPGDIPGLILRHNLHGLEICPRAAQLAEIALVFKAREKSRRFFQPEHLARPNIIELRDVRFEEGELSAYFKAIGIQPSTLHPQFAKLLHQFEEAKNFGSLIQPCLSESEISTTRAQILERVSAGEQFELTVALTHTKVLLVLEQAEALTQRHHVVVANPPYMGSSGMNGILKRLAGEFFPSSKADLFTVFVERCFILTSPSGYSALVTLQSWMFLASFIEFRQNIFLPRSLKNLVHIGYNSFPELNSKVVLAVAFVVANRRTTENEKSIFINLNDAAQTADKNEVLLERLSNQAFTTVSLSEFVNLPDCPLVYWLSPRMRASLRSKALLGGFASARIGMATGKNDRYVRAWTEISHNRIGFGLPSRKAALASKRKWFPYAKGGPSRKWFGNCDAVVDWENDGHSLQTTKHPTDDRIWAHNFNLGQIFRQAICWTVVTNIESSFRFFPEGCLFDAAAGLLQANEESANMWLLAALNSVPAREFLRLLNPTFNLHPGYLEKVPISESAKTNAETFGRGCVSIARADWDNFETSWDFRDHPLLRAGVKFQSLEMSWQQLSKDWNSAIARMQQLETENNRLFIEAYGLQDELKPEVPPEQITLARPDARKDMAAFLSYAVGCMMGRYSLDKPGLILANAGDTLANYLAKVGTREEPLDVEKALGEPEMVVLSSGANPACFACGTRAPAQEARFVLADLYPRKESEVRGRPMIYCENCARDRAGRVVLDRPLPQFSLPDALAQKWTEPETLAEFLKMTGCFAHRIPARPEEVTFLPDEDGIIPVLDGEWFEDDIVARTREFLRATFGEATLRENVRFIEDSLGKDLRKYFLTDFYKDHLQTYKKRPIYWMVQSPRKGFQCLLYLHRYTRDTMNLVLNRYLRDYQAKLRNRLTHLTELQATASTAKAKTDARKEADKLTQTLRECEEWERQTMLPLAQARIELDLDDGVKTNYLKLGEALAPIAGLAAKEED